MQRLAIIDVSGGHHAGQRQRSELVRDLNGNDFVSWAVMERACQDGVEAFDYGRSMEGSAAYHFKKHWGFEPAPLHYQYQLVNAESRPNLKPANPRYRPLIDTWKKLSLSVARTIGPPVVCCLIFPRLYYSSGPIGT